MEMGGVEMEMRNGVVVRDVMAWTGLVERVVCGYERGAGDAERISSREKRSRDGRLELEDHSRSDSKYTRIAAGQCLKTQHVLTVSKVTQTVVFFGVWEVLVVIDVCMTSRRTCQTSPLGTPEVVASHQSTSALFGCEKFLLRVLMPRAVFPLESLFAHCFS